MKRFLLINIASILCLKAMAASDLPPQPLVKNLIPNALQIQLTPKGQQYFSTKLTSILGNLGVSMNEGFFDAQELSADQPINLDELAKKNPEEIKIFKQVRSLMTQWFVGLSLSDPRPMIQIGQSEYTAKISKLGLETDQSLMNSIGKSDGAVLAIDFEIKKLAVKIDKVRAWDLDNSQYGKIGLDQVEINVADEITPLKARIPFYVRINSNGVLEFEALKLTENIGQVPLEFKYKQIVVPSVSVSINGKTFDLNNQELEKYINSMTPQFVEFARKQLTEFTQKQVPDLLNKKSKEFLTGGLEQVQLLDPPGAEPDDGRPPLLWGLQLQKFLLQNQNLNLSLAAYIEDTYRDAKKPVAPPPLNPKYGSRGQATVNLLPIDKYDLTMTVDRALINRVLQLSYNRKNFEKIELQDKTHLALRDVPRIDYAKPPIGAPKNSGLTYLKLHLVVEQEIPDGSFEDWFLNDKIVVAFDVLAKLQQVSDKSGLEIVLVSIDTDSATMDTKYLSFLGRIFSGKVMNGVKDKLKKTSAKWVTGNEKIPGKLEFPPQVLGLKMDIVQLVMDPAGQLVMYLNFASGAR